MKYNDARYRRFDLSGEPLSDEDAAQGWHYCESEWDGMLVGPEMTAEWECCGCFAPDLKKRLESRK